MKKQLFSFLMVLALVVLAGTSVFAAPDDGLTPATAKEQVIGSTTNFSYTKTGSNTVAWTVLQALKSTYVPGGATAAATSGSHFNWVTNATGQVIETGTLGASVFVKWLSAPTSPTYDMYIVRTEETTGDGCSTIREVYITTFDFTFDVYLSDAGGNSIEAAAGEPAICNSWDATVVANSLVADATGTPPIPAVDPLDAGNITSAHANYVNNPTSRTLKTTKTYYTVEVQMLGGGKTMKDISMRVQYSLPTQTALGLYQITAPTLVAFEEGGSNDNVIVAANATSNLTIGSLAAYTYTGNNTMYIAKDAANTSQTAKYTFEVLTHNNLGQSDMVYNLRVDKVDLDFKAAPSNYGNGSKINDAVSATYTNEAKLAAGVAVSESQTIRQSPATPVITIAD